MNLYRIHIRPQGGTDDMVATFQHCLENNLLGVGWRVDGIGQTTDWKVYEQIAKLRHDSLQQPRYIFNYVKPEDLVWTRDPRNQYYLAYVTGGWEYWTNQDGGEKDIDIGNIFRCDFCRVPLDAVPGTVVSSFGYRGRTIQSIHDRSARAYSQHLWNTHAKQQVYKVNFAKFPDIFSMLDPEETEDLVFLYLQSQGWYVVPNSRKGNTLRFEFMLANSDSGEKALTQVKTGTTELNIDDYTKDEQRIFLFQSNENYKGQPAKNVELILRRELADFLKKKIYLFPQSFQTKLKLIGDR